MSDPLDLAGRLARLERRERAWRRGAGALLAAGAALVLSGQGGGERVAKLEKLILVDADGKARAVLHVDRTQGRDTWATHLTFFDPQGQPRLDIANWDHGASAINLWAPEAGRGAILCTPKDRTAFFSLYNGGKKLELGIDPDGGASRVDLKDRAGVLRARLGTQGEKDLPDVVLYDPQGEPRVSLTRGKRGDPAGGGEGH